MDAMNIAPPLNNVNLGSNYFDSIPDELTEIILKSLPVQDQLAAEGVCRKWKELINSGTLRIDYLPPRGKLWSYGNREFYIPFYNVGIDDIGNCYIGKDNMGGDYKAPNMVTEKGEISKKLANKVFKVVQRACFEGKKTENESQKIKDKIKEAFKNRVWEGNDLNHKKAKGADLCKITFSRHKNGAYVENIIIDGLIVDPDGSISNVTMTSYMLYSSKVKINLPPSFMELINEVLNTEKKYEKVYSKIKTELKTDFVEINKTIEFIKT